MILSEELKKIIEDKQITIDTERKINWLVKKWNYPRYQRAEEAPLMSSILFMPTQPIHICVVMDDLDGFKVKYEHTFENANSFLMEACLCSSRNIAEYLLLEIMRSNYKEHPELLCYIAASMDIQWAKDVASILKQEDLPMPQDIHRLADGNMVKEIIEIFNPAPKCTLRI